VVLKENGYLNWYGSGYTSFDEAKAAVGKIMEKMPEFLVNENLRKTITQDLNTGGNFSPYSGESSF